MPRSAISCPLCPAPIVASLQRIFKLFVVHLARHPLFFSVLLACIARGGSPVVTRRHCEKFVRNLSSRFFPPKRVLPPRQVSSLCQWTVVSYRTKEATRNVDYVGGPLTRTDRSNITRRSVIHILISLSSRTCFNDKCNSFSVNFKYINYITDEFFILNNIIDFISFIKQIIIQIIIFTWSLNDASFLPQKFRAT